MIARSYRKDRGIPTHHIIKPLTLALSFVFTSLLASSQVNNLRFDRLTTERIIREKGISQNTIQCITQDSKGFMWIGTWDGLNRYDGYEFTIFAMESGLSNSTIYDALEDDRGYIWAATADGLNRMDWDGKNVVIYKHSEEDANSISDNRVNALFQDSHGDLWLGTSNGLNKFDPVNQSFSAYTFYSEKVEPERSNWITSIIEDKKGMLWVATYHGVHRFNPVDETFDSFHFDEGMTGTNAYSANTILCLMEEQEGRIWLGTRFGIFILDPVSGSFEHILANPGCEQCLQSNIVNALFQDKSGKIWVATDSSLDIYNEPTGKFHRYVSSSSTTSLSNNDVRCFFEGDDGTIWVGTYKGLNKADQSSSRFTHYYHLPDDPNSLSNNIVYSIIEDEDRLVWIATYEGVNILDRSTEKFRYLKHKPSDPSSISSDRIRALCEDRQGYIWIGTETAGLNRYDRSTGKVKLYVHDDNNPFSLPEDNILFIKEDSKGRLWVGTNKGVSYKEKGSDNFTTIDSKSRSLKLAGSVIWSIYEDKGGYIWIGTKAGLNRFDPDLRKIEYFFHDPSDPSSISSNMVFSVYEDNENIFWIGTMGGGLNRYNPRTGVFKTFTEKDGLPNNVVYSTIEDEENNLWITTNYGLAKFDKLTETFVKYDALDGVQGNEFNAGAYFRNDRGEIYIGGMNGFNVFHPSDIKVNRNVPRIVITGFRIFNELTNREIFNGDTIDLNYSDNFFSFEFSALDYTNPDKNWYRYQLENFDPEWTNTSPTRRYAQYQKVSPGSYVFHVTGTNNDGVWNPVGATVTILIRPPWWQTWSFRILMVLLVVSIGWGFIYWRLNYIRRKHEIEKKMLNIEKQIFDLEQKALRLQMNPHFIFNSLNAIQNFVIINDTDKAVNYLAKFSHLMRMILANSIQSYIPLKDELKALTYYMDLEKLRFDDKFDYTIQLDPNIDTEFLEVPPMLLQPYVENAIIHGLVHIEGKGNLMVSLRKLKDSLVCVIEDNGIGREKANLLREQSGIKRKPRGMMITQERLELLSKQRKRGFSVKVTDLKDKKGQAAGTRVEIVIHSREIQE